MRAHEKDEKIKIPKWYMSLPIGVIEKINEIVMRVAKILPSHEKKKNTGNIRFYI